MRYLFANIGSVNLLKNSCTLFITLFFSCLVSAEELMSKDVFNESTPQVGKHAMANIDAGSMILSLLMVLALIIISALLLKRFNIVQQGGSQLKVVDSLSLGAKERVVVIQAGKKQLMPGVTPSQVTLLESLDEPLPERSSHSTEMPSSVLKFLQKNQTKQTSK